MKKITYFVGAAVTALALLTSCLGESTNETDLTISGVVHTSADAGYKTLIDAGTAEIYIPNLSSLGNFPDNSCIGTSIHINYNSAENANWGTTGYLTATANSTPVAFNQWRATPITSVTDTAGVLENEIPLTYAFQQSSYSNYVRGWMIFTSGAKISGNQTVEWSIKYPSNLAVEEVNGKRCYNFYIRAAATGSDTGATGQAVVNAWYVQTVLNTIDSKEKSEGNSSYYLKFNYVSSLNSETKLPVWKYDLAQMSVTSSSSN